MVLNSLYVWGDAARFSLRDTTSDKSPENAIMLTLRESTLDADMLSLIILAADRPEIDTVHIAVSSVDRFERRHNPINYYFESADVTVNTVEIHSTAFHSALADSRLVFIRNSSDILEYRFLDTDSDRKYVQIYHGLAKGSGNFRSIVLQKNEPLLNSIPYRKPILTRVSNATSLYTVASDIERCYRAAADGVQPALIQTCGYPKYDRLRQLLAGGNPVLPDSSRKILVNDDDQKRILYAPTHRGSYGVTTLFPFDNFSIKDLRERLRALNAQLYIRMHISEEEAGIYDDVVDGDLIRYAGHSFSPSSVEILPYFDSLITDFSSIYTEFLLTDRPIIFVQDTDHPYWSEKGLAYEYDAYYPGPKVESFESFLRALTESIEKPMQDVEPRDFARKSLLQDTKQPFLDAIYEAASIEWPDNDSVSRGEAQT